MAGRAKNKRPIEEIRAERHAAEAEAAAQPRPIADDWKARAARHWTPQEKAELMKEIIERMIAGQSIASMGKLPHMPVASGIVEWFMADHESRERYVRAREIAAEVFAQEIIEISDDKTEDPNSRRVRIEARKWVASKLLPRIYGDRIEVLTPPTSAIPNARVVDLVNASDQGAESMLMLEQVKPLTRASDDDGAV